MVLDIIMIAAMGTKDRVIGRDNDLPWSDPLKEDKKRFKGHTLDHTVIMGRRTWDSIEEKYRPLPRRENIVVTRQQGLTFPGARTAHSLHGALSLVDVAGEKKKAFIIGGSALYELGLKYAHELLITRVAEDVLGDTFFPEYEHLFTVVEQETIPAEGTVPELTFERLVRR